MWGSSFCGKGIGNQESWWWGKTEALWGEEKNSDTGAVFSQFLDISEKLFKNV